MSKLYGGFGELPLREAVIGAPRQTFQRALAELFDEVDELREGLRMMSHKVPWDETELCFCAVAPFDDGSTKRWWHDNRCAELRALLDND